VEAYRLAEMLRMPQCVDSRLIDGSKVVSPTHQPHFTPQEHYFVFNVSGTHFCYRLSKPQGLVRPEGLDKQAVEAYRVVRC
jgi:hypothetical protein